MASPRSLTAFRLLVRAIELVVDTVKIELGHPVDQVEAVTSDFFGLSLIVRGGGETHDIVKPPPQLRSGCSARHEYSIARLDV